MSEIITIQVDDAPQGILQADWEKHIIGSLYAATPELGSDINPKIQSRTPVQRGGLVASEKFTPNTDPQAGSTLVDFAPEDAEQVDAWGRVYAPYVEGVLSSPTIAHPAEMYGLAEEEDIGDIEIWAYNTIDKATQSLTSGGATP